MFGGDALLVEGVEAVDFVFLFPTLRVERELKLFKDMMAFLMIDAASGWRHRAGRN